MNIPRPLIEKYSISGPRYTSYPSAVEFTPEFTKDRWRDSLIDLLADQLGSNVPPLVSLYIHIPFCNTLCYFCACNRVIVKNRSVVRPYIDCLIAEINQYAKLLGQVRIEQLHWGGGTPNFLLPEESEEIHNAILEAFSDFEDNADLSIEIDPRTVSYEQLERYRRLKYNRLSFGVQDFDPSVQRLINRWQPFELTRDVCDTARRLEYESINIDLIYGLPGQTLAGFNATIDQVLSLRPERIALYGYAHVTWVSKTQNVFNRLPLPVPQQRIELFNRAQEKLTDAGYISIGLDHFALETDALVRALTEQTLRRNFMGYTVKKGDLLIGFGASAISSSPGAIAQNARELSEYQRRIQQHHLAVERGLKRSIDDKIVGSLIEKVLCACEIDLIQWEQHWGVEFNNYFAQVMPKLVELERDGLLEFNHDRICVTPTGRYFLRNIAMAFDRYLNTRNSTSNRVFSQAV